MSEFAYRNKKKTKCIMSKAKLKRSFFNLSYMVLTVLYGVLIVYNVHENNL